MGVRTLGVLLLVVALQSCISMSIPGEKRQPQHRLFERLWKRNQMLRATTSLTAETGELMSPGFPLSYSNFLDEVWSFKMPKGKVVRLGTESFDVEPSWCSGCCDYDYLEIIIGQDETATPYAKFCGTIGPNLIVPSDDFLVVFHTDQIVTEGGFKIVYESLDKTDEILQEIALSVCTTSPTIVDLKEGQSVELISKNFPGEYEENMNCLWIFRAPENLGVEMMFEEFHVEGGCSGGCNYDHVSLHDGSGTHSTTLGIYCQTNLPPVAITSTQRFLTVHMKTDGSVNMEGFRAKVSTAEPGYVVKIGDACIEGLRPELLDEIEGSLATDGREIGANYMNNSNCEWLIQVTEGKLAHIHFSLFELEECPFDTLTIYDGSSRSANHLGTYCGLNTPGSVLATSNTLFVVFESDHIIAKPGFEATYSERESQSPGGTGGGTGSGGWGGTGSGGWGGTGSGGWGGTGSGGWGGTGSGGWGGTGSGGSGGTGSGGTGSGGTGGTGSGGTVACGIPAVQPRSNRIVGGDEAYAHSWPWQISLQTPWGFHYCGGSIISERWIITAAHCVQGSPSDIDSPDDIRVIVGAHHVTDSSEGTQQVMRVRTVIPHPEYFSESKDIALLELETALVYSAYVRPVCLPRLEVSDTTICVTTGWGNTEGTGDSTLLQEVHVPIISQALCSSQMYYGSQINPYMVCAGYEQGGKDSCQGDSGGPLVCRRESDGPYVMHGVTSWGYGCAEAFYPGVYSRTSTLMEFIHEYTNGVYLYEP